EHQHHGLEADGDDLLQLRLHADGTHRDDQHQRDTSFVKVCSGPPIQPMLLIPASSTKATANHGSNGGRSDGAALLSVRRVSIAAQAITGTSIATRISFTIVAMSPVSREML